MDGTQIVYSPREACLAYLLVGDGHAITPRGVALGCLASDDGRLEQIHRRRLRRVDAATAGVARWVRDRRVLLISKEIPPRPNLERCMAVWCSGEDERAALHAASRQSQNSADVVATDPIQQW